MARCDRPFGLGVLQLSRVGVCADDYHWVRELGQDGRDGIVETDESGLDALKEGDGGDQLGAAGGPDDCGLVQRCWRRVGGRGQGGQSGDFAVDFDSCTQLLGGIPSGEMTGQVSLMMKGPAYHAY